MVAEPDLHLMVLRVLSQFSLFLLQVLMDVFPAGAMAVYIAFALLPVVKDVFPVVATVEYIAFALLPAA
jgi:hypothetical protein